MKGKWVQAPGGENMRYHCKNPECGVYHRSVFLSDGGNLECHACQGEVEHMDVTTLADVKITFAGLSTLMEIGKLAEAEYSRRYRIKAQMTHERLQHGNFDDSELVYAAWQRCKCSAGMAYPKNIGPSGAWYCSALLKDKNLDPNQHIAGMPFSMFDIKSEDQPSANGATTRKKS